MNWTVTYVDETQLAQFDKDNAESKFSDIDMNRLLKFCVEDFGHIVTVWPETGKYEINGQGFQYDNFSEDEYLELVYFRRVRRHINSVKGLMVAPDYFQFIGLRNVGKANQVRSKQLLIQITKDDGVKISTK